MRETPYNDDSGLVEEYASDSPAWAAGLFEGEGFLIRRQIGGRVYLQVGIEMRDVDVLERFVAVLRGAGMKRPQRGSGPKDVARINLIPRHKRNPKHSDIHRWATTGYTAEQAYAILRPWLGVRRREKGDAVIREAILARSDEVLSRSCVICHRDFVPADYATTAIYCSPKCRWTGGNASDALKAAKRRYYLRLTNSRIPGQMEF